MADTFTDKGIRLLDPLLNYDVNKINENFQNVSDKLGAIVCTSTTRPSTPYNGMVLWETDTRRWVVRVAGAWVAVPGRQVIADAAARSAIPVSYDGSLIYRQDRDWQEIFDGAAWRVQGVAHCSTAADRNSAITNPYLGQLAITQDNGHLWRWDGSIWRYAVNGTVVGGKVRDTNAPEASTTETQTLDTGAQSLISNSRYRVEAMWSGAVSAVNDDWLFRIRDTNTAGSLRQQFVMPRTANVVPYSMTASFVYSTGASEETKTWIGSVQRLAGTGGWTTQASSYIVVTYLGPTGSFGLGSL